MTKPPLFAGLLPPGLASASAQEGPPQPDEHTPGAHPAMEWHRRMVAPLMGQEAAVFRFRKDDAEIVVKCAGDEPTRACVDGAMMLTGKAAGNAAQ